MRSYADGGGKRVPILMIAADLDGTLLRTDKTISEFTLDVLLQCRKKGILTAFATARSEKASERFSSVFMPDIFISNAGALARHGQEILYRCAIPPETASRLIRRIINAPGVQRITADTINGYFVNYEIDKKSAGRQDYSYGVQYDFSCGFGFDVYKLTIEFTDTRIAERIAEDFPDISVLGFSGENWVRFAHKNSSKWEALKIVSQKCGIPPQNIAAFGDDFSDIEMLQNCGAGVAVANAIGEAKAAARYFCDSNDNDGVAKWIAENVLL